jgi:hypothetical protein
MKGVITIADWSSPAPSNWMVIDAGSTITAATNFDANGSNLTSQLSAFLMVPVTPRPIGKILRRS